MPVFMTDKFKPKNNQNFALMDAEDIAFRDGKLNEYMPVVISKADYDALPEKNPKTPYLVYEDE